MIILSARDMLEKLLGFGFARRDLARMLNQRVGIIGDWYSGTKICPLEDELQIESLLCTCDSIVKMGVWDVAAWFEVRILPDNPITPIDLYVSQGPTLVMALAQSTVEVLNAYHENWQSQRTRYETFLAEDGCLSLRLKEQRNEQRMG